MQFVRQNGLSLSGVPVSGCTRLSKQFLLKTVLWKSDSQMEKFALK